MTNARLGVRRREDTEERNSHGERVTSRAWDAATALHPGRTRERADGGWGLGLDPALWPVRQGDLVVDDAGGEWLVSTADLIRNNLDPRVDWIRVDAAQRTPAGTEPGGPEFAGR